MTATIPNANLTNGKIPQASQEKSDTTRSTPLDIYSAATIPAVDLEACLDLVELTSGEAYAASSGGWSRPKKRKEMKLPDMKYLIVRGEGRSAATQSPRRDAADAPARASEATPSADEWEDIGFEADAGAEKEQGEILGFLSFMVTYEDGKEVVYCYEIHLSSEARGKGLGRLLISRMEDIGKAVGLEKAMLTVFKSNTVARAFYEKGGYGVDENSPQPRRLRNGTIKEVDYLILSKMLR